MIGVILAAGLGRRLSDEIDLEKIGPKCLLTINGFTLLERMVSDLVKLNIKSINIIVGYKADLVNDVCTILQRKYGVGINLVYNNEYLSTNTAYSLDIGLRDVLDEDVIIFNGDVLYEYAILSDLIKINQTAISIDNKKMLTEESFKLIIVNNEIESIGKTVPMHKATGEFIGISKIIRSDLGEVKRLLRFLISENPNHYYDLIFMHLSKSKNLAYSFTKGMKWTEIDDSNDFEYAKNIVNKSDKSREHLTGYQKSGLLALGS